MLRFLLNSNISYKTANFLNSLGHDAKTVAQFNLSQAKDKEIVGKAVKEGRIIITFDLDFGEIFYFSRKEKFGVVVLRLRDQTVESVNRTMKWFLETGVLRKKEYQRSLIIVEEGKIRIRKKS